MIELSKLDEWEEWIPKSEREVYEHEPEAAAVMELKFVSKERRDHYQRLSKKYKGQGLVSSADTKATRDLFSDHVRNIQNLIVEDVEVVDGAQIFDIDGLDELRLEIITALMERSSLEEGLAKKLRSASASTSSHRTDSADGGAVVATPTSPQIIREATTRTGISDSPTPSNAPSADVTTRPTPSPMIGSQR